MVDEHLVVGVERAAPGVAVVSLAGDITRESEDSLSRAYDEAAAANARVVLFDFADVDYMNSGGIGLLVMLLVRARRAHRHLLATGLSKHYRQIFELTRIDEAIGTYDDRAAALAAVSGGLLR